MLAKCLRSSISLQIAGQARVLSATLDCGGQHSASIADTVSSTPPRPEDANVEEPAPEDEMPLEETIPEEAPAIDNQNFLPVVSR